MFRFIFFSEIAFFELPPFSRFSENFSNDFSDNSLSFSEPGKSKKAIVSTSATRKALN